MFAEHRHPKGGTTMQTARCAAAFAATLLLTAASGAQAAPPGIDGVWKVTNVVITGANPLTVADPQPSLYIFARGHYSSVGVQAEKPRDAAAPAKDPAKPTDAEKLAKYQEWAPVMAQAGTFEVKGGKLIRTPIVAKNVVAMGPEGRSEAEFKLSGDKLVLTSKSPAGQPAREQRLTLTRVR
jgi:hypothetical protein